MKTEEVGFHMDDPQKENESAEEVSAIDVNISEVVLTPLTCASLINEILKGVLYQKCQIPYPYSWLKSLVDKKRRQTHSEEPKPINFTAANHFRVVSSAYDTLENVMNGIMNEFKENGNSIKEVLFVLGTTPHCPKEVFTINVSSVANGHIEKNHVYHNNMSKCQQRILRNIFLSQNWMDAIDATSTCTNTYIFLKKYVSNECCSGDIKNSENIFIPSKPLSFAAKLKHVKIKLNYKQSDYVNCCNNLSVFEDRSECDIPMKQRKLVNSGNSNTSLIWYQSKALLKGFKDCYVNKVSACELW